MNLDDAQKQQVIAWLQQGATLAQVQKRLETEFGLNVTYRDVKFLVSDLQVLPRDSEPTAPTVLPGKPAKPGGLAREAAARPLAPEDREEPPPPAPPPGQVRVSVDQLARPGAMVSGNVTFTDGQSAAWYIDQMGRLGVAPATKGYRPSPSDMQEFQMALEQELARQGF
jgi:hypothetical protein